MKNKFNCVCGHTEKMHNFDPDSAFFGCMHKFFASRGLPLRLRNGELETHTTCQCYEFRPDNLRYIEEAYDRQHPNRKTR